MTAPSLTLSLPGTSPPRPTWERVPCVQVVIRTRDTASRKAAPTGAAQLAALLPEEWRFDIRLGIGEFAVLVARTEALTPESVRRDVQQSLTDPNLQAWELTGCQELACFRP